MEDAASNQWFSLFFSYNAAFFMGFFFLLSGYFVEHSYARQGFLGFVSHRLLRLGLPLLLLVVFAFGTISYLDSGTDTSYPSYLLREYLGKMNHELGPLWFIAHLLIYQLIYALLRVFGVSLLTDSRAPSLPTSRSVLLFCVVLGMASGVVRLLYPQDTWVALFGLIPVEPAHLPQYLSLFALGIIAARGQWLTRIDRRLAYRWFWIGLCAFIAGMGFPFLVDQPSNLPVMAFVRAFQEAFVCAGTILGVVVFFRTHAATAHRWLNPLIGNVYGVYLLHVFTVVGIQMAIIDINMPAVAKFFIAGSLGIVLCFASVALLRRLPGIRTVIG